MCAVPTVHSASAGLKKVLFASSLQKPLCTAFVETITHFHYTTTYYSHYLATSQIPGRKAPLQNKIPIKPLQYSWDKSFVTLFDKNIR